MGYIMQTSRCKYGLLVLCLLLFFIFPLRAQEGGEARISSVRGGGFALVSGGQMTVHQAEELEAGDFSLLNGDILRTDPETFVEIRLLPRDTLVMAAGNTSLAVFFGENGVSLELAYGRILLLGAGEAGPAEALAVRPGAAEVRVLSGDIGVDYIVPAAGESSWREPHIRVYAFSGSAELMPQAAGREGAVFPVLEKELLSLERTSAFSYIERKALGPDFFNYWNRHVPEGRLALPAETAEAAPVPEPEENVPGKGGQVLFVPPDYKPLLRTNTVKNGFIAAGMTFSLIGAGMQSLALYMSFDNGATNNILRDTGYGFIGLGVLSLGAALFINPKAPESDGPK
jgi:hypothetical protein